MDAPLKGKLYLKTAGNSLIGGPGLGNLNKRVIQAHVETMDKDHLKLKNKIRFAKCDLILNFVLEDRLVGGVRTRPKEQ